MHVNPKHTLFYIATCGCHVLSLGGSIRGGSETSPVETVVDASKTAAAAAAAFLDAMELERQEQSIASSLREDSWHRSLQANNCMDDLYPGNNAVGCNANDNAGP